jgi:hypothetical protein
MEAVDLAALKWVSWSHPAAAAAGRDATNLGLGFCCTCSRLPSEHDMSTYQSRDNNSVTEGMRLGKHLALLRP